MYPVHLLTLPFETASSSSDSLISDLSAQHTSSDKLSALPSDVQSTPVGHSATSLRMKRSALGDSGLPSTLANAFIVATSRARHPTDPSESRANESVHGRLLYELPYKQQAYGHSPKVQKNSTESSHSRTGSPVRSPSPSGARSPPRNFFGRFSTLCRVYCREHTHRSLPNPHLSLAQLFAQCRGARAQRHGDGGIEEAAPSPRSDISCTCACVPLFGSARFHSAHIFTFNSSPANFLLNAQLRLTFTHLAYIPGHSSVTSGDHRRVRSGLGTAKVKVLWAFLLSYPGPVPDRDAENDPLTRTAALCTPFSALMSLSFGILYAMRFDNMLSMYRASHRQWAKEAQKTETAIFWNVWVLMLPASHLAHGRTPPARRVRNSAHVLASYHRFACQVVVGLMLFILTFGNYGEVGRKARVVQQMADVTAKLETRCNRYNVRARAPPGGEAATSGRSRAGGSVEEKAHA
ncbi:hypothetical protein V8E53_010956 [Lactarius tabidus]